MNSKSFYDNHKNFSLRSLIEYEISPGIKCKFDLILENFTLNKEFNNGLDVGCSGNSFLYFLKNIRTKSFLDLSNIPLSQYKSEAKSILKKRNNPIVTFNPICGDIIKLPYINDSFDLVCSLDTLEHIKNDTLAISEISRVLRKNGIAIITVPHRSKYFTYQDQIIGHFRRYEIEQIIRLFERCHLKCVRYFNVYGKLMKFSLLQTLNPGKMEQSLIKMRLRKFRKI